MKTTNVNARVKSTLPLQLVQITAGLLLKYQALRRWRTASVWVGMLPLQPAIRYDCNWQVSAMHLIANVSSYTTIIKLPLS